jgi:hypothetical protein
MCQIHKTPGLVLFSKMLLDSYMSHMGTPCLFLCFYSQTELQIDKYTYAFSRSLPNLQNRTKFRHSMPLSLEKVILSMLSREDPNLLHHSCLQDGFPLHTLGAVGRSKAGPLCWPRGFQARCVLPVVFRPDDMPRVWPPLLLFLFLLHL